MAFAVLLALLVAAAPAQAREALSVRWEPRVVRQGDVAMVFVTGLPDAKAVEGSLAGQPLTFFPYEIGRASCRERV